MTPPERHAAVLEALNQQIELARAATPGPWERDWAFSTHFVVPVSARNVAADNVARLKPRQRADADLIVAAVNSFAARLEGCRRILDRRAPVLCQHCPESRQHYVSAATPMVTWPDEDWLDASAGVERREDTPDDH